MLFEIQIGDRTRQLDVRQKDGVWQITADGQPLAADVARGPGAMLSLLIEGRSYSFACARLADGTLWIGGPAGDHVAEVRDPRQLLRRRHVEQAGRVRLAAPMAGKVVRLLASPGEAVEKGQGIVVLEAMKMQNEVRSPKSGVLVMLAAVAGEAVASGQLLAEVE